MSDKYWREPVKWNRTKPGRVFCGSMCDVFEDHPEPGVRVMQDAARGRLWDLIDATPDLTWQLLTKRPENILGMMPRTGFPSNVWIGTSVEDQRRANERIPVLLAVPATVRFLSCEPLLGPVELSVIRTSRGMPIAPLEIHYDQDTGVVQRPISWVIAGGESGNNARPMHPTWVRSLRDQCVSAGIPFHFKQIGQWTWVAEHKDSFEPHAYVCETTGRTANEATAVADGGSWQGVWKVGKTAAGRELDGQIWDEFPQEVPV
jgi:protein gp37